MFSQSRSFDSTFLSPGAFSVTRKEARRAPLFFNDLKSLHNAIEGKISANDTGKKVCL